MMGVMNRQIYQVSTAAAKDGVPSLLNFVHTYYYSEGTGVVF